MYRLFCQFLVVFFSVGLVVAGVGVAVSIGTSGEMLFWSCLTTVACVLFIIYGASELRSLNSRR